MNEVRIHGDPFGADPAAAQLRGFLRLCLGSGMRCALESESVRERAAGALDGDDAAAARPTTHGLPPAEAELVAGALAEIVASSAPVVVFAAAAELADRTLLAGLAWPRAAAVLPARPDSTPLELLTRVRAELRWAGSENPPHGLPERELRPWWSLPAPPPRGAIVHLGAGPADGTDLAIAAWRQLEAAERPRLVLVVGDAEDAVVRALAVAAPEAVIVRGPWSPESVRDAAAVLLPWRKPRALRPLVCALASGRPVVVSRSPATTDLLGRLDVCLPVALAFDPRTQECAPDLGELTAALRRAVRNPAVGAAAQRFVREELVAGRPAPPPLPSRSAPGARPMLVLVAPWFCGGPRVDQAIQVARAVVGRRRIELQLLANDARAAHCDDLARLRGAAPELLPLLTRQAARGSAVLEFGWERLGGTAWNEAAVEQAAAALEAAAGAPAPEPTVVLPVNAATPVGVG